MHVIRLRNLQWISFYVVNRWLSLAFSQPLTSSQTSVTCTVVQTMVVVVAIGKRGSTANIMQGRLPDVEYRKWNVFPQKSRLKFR